MGTTCLKVNQHLHNYMGIKYSCAQGCHTNDVSKNQKNMAVAVDGPLHVAYNIPCFQNMGFIGVQFAHSVADVLNKYYEQFPCMGTLK